MSYSLDANILLYASDRSSAQYQAANGWPRIRAFSITPLTPDEAVGNVTALLALPNVRTVAEQDGFLDAYRHVTANQVARGNVVADAQLAAILFQHGVRTLYTRDRDFRKFEFFEVRDPFLP